MSQSRGYLDENPELESALDWVQEWYHIPALVVLIGFMLWNRVRNYSQFIVDGEVLFSAQDPWYHYRTTMFVVENWPATMPFDPWTYFPYGTRSGQFGTLLDQVVATVALVVGLGSPSEQTVGIVAILTPAVIGTLAAIPVYFIGRRLGGRLGGVTAVVVLALSAGVFLQRSLVGTYDHQVAEGFLQTLAVLGVMVALGVAEREKPIYEQFLERDVDALRDTVGYSLLAGFGITLYLWTWPPGVLLLGILGVFFLLWLTMEFVRGKSPEHVAIAGAIMMGAVTVFELAVIKTLSITATDHSLLQPLMAVAIGVGCVFMAWLARYMEAEDYDRSLYPVTVGGILVVVTVLMAVLTPSLLSYIVDQVLRVVGFTSSPSATVTSVGEATPLRNPLRLYQYHGLALFVAIAGAIYIAAKQFLDRDAPAEQFLVVVWGAFILAASFTQIRFGVYLVFPVAALTGFAIDRIVSWVDLSADDGVEVYEVLTIIVLVFTVVGPLLFVAPTATAVGGSAAPGLEAQGWDDGLDWMANHTPEVGAYGTGGERSLDYYGTYQIRDDFDYQNGEYGVLSWWDYGHMITVEGERIPHANPFQQGSTTAANFLLAPNESQANDVLENINEDDAKVQYVAADWKMASVNSQYGGKFFAPPRFYDVSNVSASDYYRSITSRNTGQQFNYRTQSYYDTTVVRLYRYHGSAVEPQPVVLDWEIATQNGRSVAATPADGRAIKTFRSMEQARAYVENDSTSQVGGFGGLPSERVPAMEHYRYVGSSERSAYSSDSFNYATLIEAQGAGFAPRPAGNQSCFANETSMPVGGQQYCLADGIANAMNENNPAWTKIFERVPGATVEGTGPANTTVTASVQMRNHETNETFVYRQQARTDANGNFEMTLPYSTTGYDEWGTEAGYTNVSVRAEGPYQFSTPASFQNESITRSTGTADVSEGQVIGETQSPVTVELEETSRDINVGNDSSDNGTAGDSLNQTANGTDGSTNTTSGGEQSGTATPAPGTDTGTATAEPATDAGTPAATETA
ncbi:oligosaccharyl transferase, archaeosortase A system-associated [Haloarcula nitratireducens]|uniref:dolichyl-phosphooligosaccharide-protein glycotransferase n=1 Tax=Haloarcula nitratireducens TaxID=2487749 RepID=A0AAW4P8D8_9EURY|nr:oligosaccharyl transferase, archaeosortase A system-associated [Halomicroarcula nitratireducens]MBX0294011.1 oligosaccharyl transferase, archaeosortase A system-associated [Halomicroarcula nitratireducens]